jgi:TPR repeat protein
MVNIENTVVLGKAMQLIEVGECQKAYKLLAPLLDEGMPEAQFIYSTFSVSGEESIEQFEKRSISLLELASNAGYAPAMYALATCYDAGDIVARDEGKASSLYRKAAELGYPKAKLSHGLNLFYGSNGVIKNQENGLCLMKEALTEGVEGAMEEIEQALVNKENRGQATSNLTD